MELILCAIFSDMEFMKAFLMTYSTFTTPEKLLLKLIERYRILQMFTKLHLLMISRAYVFV